MGEPRPRMTPSAGSWLCEGSLWTDWITYGTLEVVISGISCDLEATSVCSLAKEFPACFVRIVDYAKIFIADLKDKEFMHTDVLVPRKDLQRQFAALALFK